MPEREQLFDQTGLTWINPSPNMRSLTEALLYPGIGIMEFTNVSVGRGTDTPFEVVGAPWLDGEDLAAKLNAQGLPGVQFEPTSYTPTASVYKDEEVRGIRMTVTNPKTIQPVKIGIEIMKRLAVDYPDEWNQKNANTLLLNDATLEAINRADSRFQIADLWKADLDRFNAFRANFLIY